MDYNLTQVIGCAYTYEVSRAVRASLSKARQDHSSQAGKDAFSFFKKVESVDDLVEHDQPLQLRTHPITKEVVAHWYEPEVVIILGENHTIVGYAVGNDVTVPAIEFEDLSTDFDPTYFAKVWKGSCGMSDINPSFIDDSNLEVCMTVERAGAMYTAKYTTAKRKRDFTDLPAMIVAYYTKLVQRYGESLPASKKIIVGANDYLPVGTAIMTGTGIITPKKWYAQQGDVVTISCPEIGIVRNQVDVRSI